MPFFKIDVQITGRIVKPENIEALAFKSFAELVGITVLYNEISRPTQKIRGFETFR